MSSILICRLSPSIILCSSCLNNSRYSLRSLFPQFTKRFQFCKGIISKPRNFSTGVRFTEQKAVSSLPRANSNLKRSELTRLISLAKPEKWKLAGAIFLLFISSAVTMAVPFSLGKVIDIIYTSDTQRMRENLNKLCLVLCGIFLLGSVCNFGRVYLISVSGHRITKTLREKVFSSIVSQELAFFDKNKTGELINRLSADTAVVSQAVTSNVSDGLRSLVMVGAGVSMMFYMSPELALVGLAIVPPVAGMAVVYGRFVRKITKNVQDSLASATQVAEERIANIRTVKAFGRESGEFQRYSDKIMHVLQLAYKESLARGIFYGMTGLSGNVMILSVLYYGGAMVSDQHISVGNLSAFLLYAAYIGVSIGGLTSFYSETNRGIGASARLFELVDRQPAIPISGGVVPSCEPKGRMAFRGVTFTYPSRPDVPVISDLELELAPGKVTAIVGPSGSGKSTLASLLLRLYDPDRGRVELDGQDIVELDPAWLRAHVGTVSQEPVLFSGTICENILYGALDPSAVTEERLMAVAREANCYDFVTRNLPQGFETLVGERGVMLSGGQKQRVAIARALIKDPRILLLDEATSALDAESERLVQDALVHIMKGRTVLTIAHRLSTIQSADIIAVLDKGRLVERGTYHQLLAAGGPFTKLVRLQTFHDAST